MTGDTTIQGQTFLQERDQKTDDLLVSKVGPAICTFLVRTIKVSQMFTGEHAQVTGAAREFTDWIGDKFARIGEDEIQLQMTEKNFFINGQLLKLDARSFKRAVEIRTTFMAAGVNCITMKNGMAAGEIVALVDSLRLLRRREIDTLETFKQPHLLLTTVVEQEFEVPDVDERRELIELYAGLMIKTHVYFDRLRRGATPSARHIKRIIQRICDQIDARGDVFVGLVNLKLITGQDFVHGVNTAIYSMILARAVGLSKVDVVRCGMTALTQNVERLSAAAAAEREGGTFETGDDTHFQTNIGSVVALSAIGAGDVLSALRLVTSYERGFPFNKPLPPAWYQDELNPHLLSRIIEIARHYDVMTQGLEGVSARSPDRALQALMAKMGTHYDPALLKIFVNAVGVYPVGSVVELSTGERALVVKSPALLTGKNLSDANRPVVRLVDGTDRLIDLAQRQHSGIRVQRIVPDDEVGERPGALFLF